MSIGPFADVVAESIVEALRSEYLLAKQHAPIGPFEVLDRVPKRTRECISPRKNIGGIRVVEYLQDRVRRVAAG